MEYLSCDFVKLELEIRDGCLYFEIRDKIYILAHEVTADIIILVDGDKMLLFNIVMAMLLNAELYSHKFKSAPEIFLKV